MSGSTASADERNNPLLKARAGGRAALGMGWVAALLAGCATQPAYRQPELVISSAWSDSAAASAALPAPALWWRALNDPALSAFVESTLADNPTLAQAVARLDEARAQVGVEGAQRLPSVTARATGNRAKALDATAPSTDAGANAIAYATTASIGPTLGWEPDLFGRVRQSMAAADRRLDARTADADAVRLSLAADVVGNVLALRACDHSRRIDADDIRSRRLALELTRQRVAAGASAPVDEARARSGLTSARTSLAAQEEQCTRTVNALIALGGSDAAAVRALIQQDLPGPTPDTGTAARGPQPITLVPIAVVPKAELELPARVLLRHPSVRAADNDAAAAWADVGVARADRLPRIDLAAALTGNWIRAAGTTLRYTAWSLGSSVSGTVFDGGAGAAQVDAAEARYRAAVAALQLAVRSATQDVENALAASGSAEARAALTTESVDAAQKTFVATQAQWQAGAVSLFELEDARRQLSSALDAAVAADRDRGQAWVALVKASGNALTIPERTTP